jgi:GxxExxY protein
MTTSVHQRIEPSPRVDQLAHDVIGAAIEVHRILGPGFLESVYEEALCVELHLRSIPFERQILLPLKYKDHDVGGGRLDVLVGGELLLELKAVDAMHPVHHAQLISYLRAPGLTLGLLMNFNVRLMRAGIKRIIVSDETPWRL